MQTVCSYVHSKRKHVEGREDKKIYYNQLRCIMCYLKDKIRECCTFGDFALTSGKKSDFYVNVKELMFDPHALSLLGEELFFEIDNSYGEIDCIGGMEMGSIPLTSSIAVYSHTRGDLRHPISHFVVRKEPRKHGMGSQIEGTCFGDIILVDDVLTTGGSLLKTCSILNEAGLQVCGAVVVVDREEEDKLTIPFPVVSLFNKSELQEL